MGWEWDYIGELVGCGGLVVVVVVLDGFCVWFWLCCLIRLHVFAAFSIISQTVPLFRVAEDGVSITIY